MRTFPTFDAEGCCAPTIFEGPVTNHDCFAHLDCPGDVSFCRLGGLVLDIECVGEQGFGLLLKVVTKAYALYEILG